MRKQWLLIAALVLTGGVVAACLGGCGQHNGPYVTNEGYYPEYGYYGPDSDNDEGYSGPSRQYDYDGYAPRIWQQNQGQVQH